MEKREQMYEGKAKKVFATDNEDYCIVAYKDDATAFNGEKKGTIVGKGVVNNRMSINALLTAEGRIETKEDEQLTRELRILALLRLGITSNKEIASILRASIATVYTYRSRLKTRALNKETFEDDVASIHSESNNP